MLPTTHTRLKSWKKYMLYWSLLSWMKNLEAHRNCHVSGDFRFIKIASWCFLHTFSFSDGIWGLQELSPEADECTGLVQCHHLDSAAIGPDAATTLRGLRSAANAGRTQGRGPAFATWLGQSSEKNVGNMGKKQHNMVFLRFFCDSSLKQVPCYSPRTMLYSIPHQRQCYFPLCCWGYPFGQAWDFHPKLLWTTYGKFFESVSYHVSPCCIFYTYILCNVNLTLTFIFLPMLPMRSRFFLESSHRIGTRRWASTSRCKWFQGFYAAEICSSSRSQSLCTAAFWSLKDPKFWGLIKVEIGQAEILGMMGKLFIETLMTSSYFIQGNSPKQSRYHETMNLVPNDSEYAEAELKHHNIFVMRHRSRFNSNLLWTHHETLALAFVFL